MAKKLKESPTSESVRIHTDAISICKKVKDVTGIPIGRFIVEAIHEKASRLPKKIKEQILAS